MRGATTRYKYYHGCLLALRFIFLPPFPFRIFFSRQSHNPFSYSLWGLYRFICKPKTSIFFPFSLYLSPFFLFPLNPLIYEGADCCKAFDFNHTQIFNVSLTYYYIRNCKCRLFNRLNKKNYKKTKSITTLFIVGNAGNLCVGNVSGSDGAKPSSSLEITRFICSESRTVYVEYIQLTQQMQAGLI